MKTFKKIVAVICAALMMTGVLSVAASAADGEKALDESGIKAVETQVAGALIAAEDGAMIESDADLPYDADGDGKVTALEIASVLGDYVFADEESLAGYADRIADDSTFTVTVTKDGKSTVYIAVPVEKYPQLFNAGVFNETVKKLAEKQDGIKTDDMDLMKYEHIAGELALHAAIYAATYFAGGEDEGNIFHDFYELSRIADLNVDEQRAPGALIRFIGLLVTFFNTIAAFFASIV